MTRTETTEWATLEASWELSLRADGCSPNTLRVYRQGLASLRAWLEAEGYAIEPAELTRDHVRGWLAHAREHHSPTSAKTWFAGVRNFTRWLVAEDEAARDATDKIRYPLAAEPRTPVLTPEELRRLLATTDAKDFTSRRDRAILTLLADSGIRREELLGLRLDDLDLLGRSLVVSGKGSRRSGPRRRLIPLGFKTCQTLDRYLRERRRHPQAELPWLWLGAFGQGRLSTGGLVAMLERRGQAAGIPGLHAHVFRHTWAHQYRADGGSEGDLMTLGGWRNRNLLDRYGASAASERAAESARKHSLADRL